MPALPDDLACRPALAQVRGAARLAVEATTGITDVVEAMHRAIAAGPAVLGRPLETPARLLAGPVFTVVRAIARAVGTVIESGLEGVGGALAATGEIGPKPEPDAVHAMVAALNGVVGDHLAASGNPLALELRLLHEGRPLALGRGAGVALPRASRTLLVLVHGCCMSDRGWVRRGHDHGAALARDLGVTPIYAHYNSGLHISSNGRALAEELERLVLAQPSAFDEVLLLGHSMGGLVARSACWFGEVHGHAWRTRLRKLVCLGSPHQGALLERGGQWLHVLLGVSRYSAPLGSLARIRSAGVTDMRFGDVLDEHWVGRDRFALRRDHPPTVPLPAGVDCYAMAATRSPPGTARPRGDGLVRVGSALGRHRDPARALGFAEGHTRIVHDTGHLELLGRPEVYDVLRSWLAS